MRTRMSLLACLPSIRTALAGLFLGGAILLGSVLTLHFMDKADSEQAENRRLKDEVRDLVARLAEIEGVLQDVGEQRQAVDDLSLATLGAVIDTAALDTEQNGRLYRALRMHQDDDGVAVRAARIGPPAAAATYPALVERMTTLRDHARSLARELQATGKDLGHRQEILAAIPSRLPARGWISSEFGVRKSPFHGNEAMHYGLDIAADEGTPVVAPADGVVTYASVYGSYGKLIKIDHDFGISTRFAHNAQLLVRRGQKVHRGDPIAVIGSTGRSTGPHVHYEILVHGQPVDPARFVLERPQASLKTAALTVPLAPKYLGIGGDAEPTEASGQMGIAADPDADPLANQRGFLPMLRGERLLTTPILTGRLALVTTTDLYLMAPMLLLSALLILLIRLPTAQWQRLARMRKRRVTVLPAESVWTGFSLWMPTENDDERDD